MKLPFISEKKHDLQPGDEPLPRAPQGESVAALDLGDDLIPGLQDLYCPEKPGRSHLHDIADVLLDMGRISPEQYRQLRREQQSHSGTDPAEYLVSQGLVGNDEILMARAKQCGMEFRRIEPEQVDRGAFDKLDFDFIKNNNIMPVSIDSDVMVLATSEPSNVLAVDDVKRKTRMEVQVVVCRQEDIETICESFREKTDDYQLDDIISDMTEVEVVQDQEKNFEDLEKMAGQSPVIKFVNYLISNAIHEGASDIHIEPKGNFTRIRYRIDGVLFETMQAPLKMHPAVVSRIKIMSNLDISERRLPQDGKISVIVGGRGIDLRISTLPTNRGEKVVIRVLDSRSIMRGLENLGMDPALMDAFRQQISLPHGIFLVTGPTGSGKSTTLYSALSQMDGDRMNISTVEDPVEYELGFCNQVQVNEKVGLTFGLALRSLLRQDPDIIMVGEIRDGQTASIAVQAALTGHLVLSTLHTNDAAGSITRLVNIGIDPYLVAASVNGVLAQRLVRKICRKCKEPYEIPANVHKYAERAGIEPKQFFHGAGCEECRQSGYAGRMGIYELLVIDERFRDVINNNPSVGNVRRAFRQSRQASLFDDGIRKVKQGLTTLEEVLRVTEVYGQSKDESSVEDEQSC